MGYFSNGTEGMDYEGQWCVDCVHYQGCPIWGAHFEHNYTKDDGIKALLNDFIPRRKDGLGNEKCRMFFEQSGREEKPKIPLKGTL